MQAVISVSKDLRKKFDVKIQNKVISFGAQGYQDFITSKGDESKKENYIKRHQKNEDWSNPLTAGFWSRWMLWNKRSLAESAKDIEKKFGIRVKLSI